MRKLSGKPIISIVVLLIIVLFNADISISASEDAVIVEKFTTQDGLVLYAKGIEGTNWEAAYQVGTNACTVEKIDTVRESGEPIYTLILWDNSLSVMNRQGDRIRDILLDIMANRAVGEKFAVALIDNETVFLTEYTDDYAALKQAVESVEGENQDAYIIENLYEAILDLNRIPDTGYKRVFLISDGMDAVEVGYSKAELDALLEKTPYPIYTMGLLDGNHTEELQNLFALSRATGAEYFYMDEMDEFSAVTRALSADLDILRISVSVPEELCDGSAQNSRLVLESEGGSYTLQSQVTLPFAETDSESGAEPDDAGMVQGDVGIQDESQNETGNVNREEDQTDNDVVTSAQTDIDENAAESGTSIVLIGSVAGAVILILIVVIVIIFSKKKKKKENDGDDYEKLDQRLKNERHKVLGNGSSALGEEESCSSAKSAGAGDIISEGCIENGRGILGTALFQADIQHGNDFTGNSTRLLFDEPLHRAGKAQAEEIGKRIVLTDIKDAVRSYGCGIVDRIVIGRNSACCNLAIGTDNAVSERHCEMEYREGRFYIRDLASSNGTFVNGTRIQSEVEVTMGSTMKIGRSEYRLTIE